MEQLENIKIENENLNKLKQKISDWDAKEKPLAPLDDYQLDVLEELNQLEKKTVNFVFVLIRWHFFSLFILQIPDIDEESGRPKTSGEGLQSLSELNDPNMCIESTQEFLSWYNNIDDKILEQFDYIYLEYYDQLKSRTAECDDLLAEVSFPRIPGSSKIF